MHFSALGAGALKEPRCQRGDQPELMSPCEAATPLLVRNEQHTAQAFGQPLAAF